MISNGHLQHQTSTLGSDAVLSKRRLQKTLEEAWRSPTLRQLLTLPLRAGKQKKCGVEQQIGTTAASAALLARQVSQRRQVREHELDRPPTTVTHVHYKA